MRCIASLSCFVTIIVGQIVMWDLENRHATEGFGVGHNSAKPFSKLTKTFSEHQRVLFYCLKYIVLSWNAVLLLLNQQVQ